MERFTKEEIAECSKSTLLETYCHALTASWKWVTATEIVEKGPGIISYVILTAKGQATAVYLYDGTNTTGKVIAILETSSAQSRPYAFHDHLLFERGLYVVVDGNTQGILIVWHPISFGILKS